MRERSTVSTIRVGTKGLDDAPSKMLVVDVDSPDLVRHRENEGYIGDFDSFFVQLIAPAETCSTFAGPCPSVSWGIQQVGAHQCEYDGRGVVVAVLDTGIDRHHPAFTGLEVIEEDFTGEGNGDSNGHGTHCAGIICGRDVDGVRIGIARGMQKLLVGKVLGAKGLGTTERIFSAIEWAVRGGADIISMSLSLDFVRHQAYFVQQGNPTEAATSMALEAYLANYLQFESFARCVRSGTFNRRRALLLAASGNQSRRSLTSGFTVAKGLPAATEGYLAVGAIEQVPTMENGIRVAPYSNTGVDVVAPGSQILSAKAGGGLVQMSGTSMATPHVAGVATLWAQKLMKDDEEGFDLERVRTRLLANTCAIPGFRRADVGNGLIKAPQ